MRYACITNVWGYTVIFPVGLSIITARAIFYAPINVNTQEIDIQGWYLGWDFDIFLIPQRREFDRAACI